MFSNVFIFYFRKKYIIFYLKITRKFYLQEQNSKYILTNILIIFYI